MAEESEELSLTQPTGFGSDYAVRQHDKLYLHVVTGMLDVAVMKEVDMWLRDFVALP